MSTLMQLPQATVIYPGHADTTTVAREWESNPFIRVWRGLDPEGTEPCTAMDRPATLVLRAPDYDGGTKAWVRWAGRERRHRRRLPGHHSLKPLSPTAKSRSYSRVRALGAGSMGGGMAREDEKIPSSRVRRTATVATLAASEAVKQFGTRAANLARDDRAAEEAMSRRQLETAKQIVAVLGTMKGAAMKLGQVMSFLDVGLVPEEHREEFQRELAKLRDAAPTVSFRRDAAGDRR